MIEGGYSTGSTIASQLGRFRPIPDITGHRLLLENLYDCSANLHSGSGIGRGSSYNCYQEIARELQLAQAGPQLSRSTAGTDHLSSSISSAGQ